jgi:hypothetical protein
MTSFCLLVAELKRDQTRVAIFIRQARRKPLAAVHLVSVR